MVVDRPRAEGRQADLLALWCDGDAVHMALASRRMSIRHRSFRSPCRRRLSLDRASTMRLRSAWSARSAISTASSRKDVPTASLARSRRLAVTAPLGNAARPRCVIVDYEFLPVKGHGLHQIPVGPVHAGIIEPGHFRFTANGETVARLEERLGYVHKGVDRLMRRLSIMAQAARIAARISGDSDGGLWFRLCARGRSGARHRAAGASADAARHHGRARTRSPIISAISAPSATTPLSRSHMPIAAFSASASLRYPTKPSVIV